MLVNKYYTSGGTKDKTLNAYFDMPDYVIRGGQKINIAANNNQVFNRRKRKK